MRQFLRRASLDTSNNNSSSSSLVTSPKGHHSMTPSSSSAAGGTPASSFRNSFINGWKSSLSSVGGSASAVSADAINSPPLDDNNEENDDDDDDDSPFSVTVPNPGPLGLDLRVKVIDSSTVARGAVIKGFRPVGPNDAPGVVQSSNLVSEGDILISLGLRNVESMPFSSIIDYAASLQLQPSTAWPLTITFKKARKSSTGGGKISSMKTSFFRASNALLNPAQDGNFNEKLQYFKDFFATKPATASESECASKMPSEAVVEEMYKDLLTKRGVPEEILSELSRIETLEHKWEIVWAAENSTTTEDSNFTSVMTTTQDNNNSVILSSGETDTSAAAARAADKLVSLKWDARGVKDLESLLKCLGIATEEWVVAFVNSFGLEYLAAKLPDPSPFATIDSHKFGQEICENICHILLRLNHFASGVESIITMPGLVTRILLCFHTENVRIKTRVLQLLGLVCYTNADGHAAVLAAYDEYKVTKGESIRFSSLVETLVSTRYDMAFREDVLSFINIVVNKTLTLEDRVNVRRDFIKLGIASFFTDFRSRNNNTMTSTAGDDDDDDDDNNNSSRSNNIAALTVLDNVEKQIEVFEAFMKDDHTMVVYDNTDLSSIDSVISNLVGRGRNKNNDGGTQECILSILQHLLFIPSDGAIGTQMWTLCERTMRNITCHTPPEELENYKLSYDDRKTLLALRDQFTEFLSTEKVSEANGVYNIGPIELLQNKKKVEDDDSAVPFQEEEESVVVTEEEVVVSNDDISKYKKLIKMGMPKVHVALKMKAEGFDPSLLEEKDNDEGGGSSNDNQQEHEEAVMTAAEHPDYKKFFKLLKLGMPPQGVKLKMKQEGLDESYLDTPNAPVITKQKEEKVTLVKDSPLYQKYFKLQKMGMPVPQLQLKMKADGLNPDLLLTPDAIMKEDEESSSEKNSLLLGYTEKKPSIPLPPPVAPKPKIRNLYWESLHNTSGTIWDDEDEEQQQQPIMNSKKKQNLEKLFSTEPATKSKQPSVKKAVQSTTTQNIRKQKVQLVDVKRGNNVGIMLARFRLPLPALKTAILQVDTTVLNVEKVLALAQFAPTEEELDTVSSFKGDVATLGDTEQYFLQIKSIPRFKTRCEAIACAWQFESNVNELQKLVKVVNDASEQLQHCTKFKRVLRQILRIGNVLNAGSSTRANARGFRVGILIKLAQLKTVTSTTDSCAKTLLHYVAASLREEDPSLLDFALDIPALEASSKVTTQLLRAGMASINSATAVVTSEQKAISTTTKEDKFQEFITPYVTDMSNTRETLQENVDAMNDRFKATASLYGEKESDDISPESFFPIISSFSSMLLAADRENERKRMAEERRLRREAATRARLESLKKSKTSSSTTTTSNDNQSDSTGNVSENGEEDKRAGLSFLKEADALEIVKQIKIKRALEQRNAAEKLGGEKSPKDSLQSIGFR